MSPPLPAPREVNAVGEIVGVYEYGDPDGAPVMVFHGTPACGAGFAWADAPARERGLRLIAPDRPGVGLSSRVPTFRVAEPDHHLAVPRVQLLLEALHRGLRTHPGEPPGRPEHHPSDRGVLRDEVQHLPVGLLELVERRPHPDLTHARGDDGGRHAVAGESGARGRVRPAARISQY